MKTRKYRHLDFEIDKLMNSIEEVLSGRTFETDVVRLHEGELEKREWLFDWQKELQAGHEVYKLVTRVTPRIIQGLISIEERHDHIFIDLIESASFNRGKGKLFRGVAANLVAFACKISFERGYQGYVAFAAKSLLIEHYQTSLGAKRLYGNHMLLDTAAAMNLINSYYKEFDVTGL